MVSLAFRHLLRAGFDALGYERLSGHRRVTCVTFPRSGHHLLARLLARYYWKRPAVPLDVLWDGGNWRGGFHYCDSYRHCGRTPCPHPGNTFQKQHDFGLRLPRLPGGYYLVQYRYPLDSLISRFQMETSRLRSIEDSVEVWLDRSREWGLYWREFVRKWALASSPNVVSLSYESLVSEPFESLRRVVEFLSPAKPVDEPLLRACIETERPSAKRDLTAFKYFDEKHFRALERELLPEMRALGIPPRLHLQP